MKRISIKAILGSPDAILMQDGIRVASEVKKHISSKGGVTLSFRGLQHVNNAFCKALATSLHDSLPTKERKIHLDQHKFKRTMNEALHSISHPSTLKQHRKILKHYQQALTANVAPR